MKNQKFSILVLIKRYVGNKLHLSVFFKGFLSQDDNALQKVAFSDHYSLQDYSLVVAQNQYGNFVCLLLVKLGAWLTLKLLSLLSVFF